MNLIRKLLGYKDLDIDRIIHITDTRAYINKEDFFALETVQNQVERMMKSELVKKINASSNRHRIQSTNY